MFSAYLFKMRLLSEDGTTDDACHRSYDAFQLCKDELKIFSMENLLRLVFTGFSV